MPHNDATYLLSLFNRLLVLGKTDEAVTAQFATRVLHNSHSGKLKLTGKPSLLSSGCDTWILLTGGKVALSIYPEGEVLNERNR